MPWHSEVAATGEAAAADMLADSEEAAATVEVSVVATWAGSEAVASPEAALVAVAPSVIASQAKAL
jgi:hypothetical protein